MFISVMPTYTVASKIPIQSKSMYNTNDSIYITKPCQRSSMKYNLIPGPYLAKVIIPRLNGNYHNFELNMTWVFKSIAPTWNPCSTQYTFYNSSLLSAIWITDIVDILYIQQKFEIRKVSNCDLSSVTIDSDKAITLSWWPWEQSITTMKGPKIIRK